MDKNELQNITFSLMKNIIIFNANKHGWNIKIKGEKIILKKSKQNRENGNVLDNEIYYLINKLFEI